MWRIIGKRFGEGKRQFSRWIYVAENHISYGIACFRTDIPALHHGGHFAEPRHGVGVAGEGYYHRVAIGFYKCFDYSILIVG